MANENEHVETPRSKIATPAPAKVEPEKIEKPDSEACKLDPCEVTEEGKAFRSVVQRFVDSLYEGGSSLQNGDVLHQITDALKFEYGRVILGKVLLGDPRISDVCYYYH